jgi:DNA-binding MarR family transcriptional regulator
MNNRIETEADPTRMPVVVFLQTARIAVKYGDSYIIKNTGLSDVKFMVLMAYYNNPNASLTASQIAQWTDTAPHNVTTLIRRMQQEGLLKTERDKKDKRTLNIKITEKGLIAARAAFPVALKIFGRLMSSITPEDALIFDKCLKIIRQNAYEGLAALQEI